MAERGAVGPSCSEHMQLTVDLSARARRLGSVWSILGLIESTECEPLAATGGLDRANQGPFNVGSLARLNCHGHMCSVCSEPIDPMKHALVTKAKL